MSLEYLTVENIQGAACDIFAMSHIADLLLSYKSVGAEQPYQSKM